MRARVRCPLGCQFPCQFLFSKRRKAPEVRGWLQREYKLEPNEAAVVLGTAIQYHVAEVVDPLVHVVAKLPKKALEPLSH
jgi:acetamidase/formamidase